LLLVVEVNVNQMANMCQVVHQEVSTVQTKHLICGRQAWIKRKYFALLRNVGLKIFFASKA
jgi:hypothetical protein